MKFLEYKKIFPRLKTSVKILVFSFIFIFFINSFHVLAASASFFVSGGGAVYTSTNVNLSVSVNGSEAYNAVTVNVTFSNLTYLSASASSNWTPVSGPSRSGNTITFSGAVLGSSYTGSRNVLNLSFKTSLAAGSATVSASGQIALLKGGTLVNGGGNTVTYTVSTPPPPPTPAPDAPAVTSTSHPDQNTWYKSKDVSLAWNLQSGVSDFSYTMDQKPGTVPDDISEGVATTKNYSVVIDGSSYFHIKARNTAGWGTATHFKINIDSLAPQPFTITQQKDPATGEFVLYFSTLDGLGDPISQYLVKANGLDLGVQKSGLKLKDLQDLQITAVDKAGNTISSTITVTTTVIPTSISPNPKSQSTSSANDNSILQVILYVVTCLLAVYSVVITLLFLRGKLKK